MEIKVKQEKFAKALSNVSRVAAGSRTTLPILNNALIRVDDGKVSLTTTNLDMAVVNYLPTAESKNGVVTVPARLIAEFVSNLPRKEVVHVVATDTKVTIKAAGYSSTINGAAAEDFPELPEMSEEKMVTFRMGADAFKAGVSQVMVAASSDTTRPVLTGVYFNTFEGVLYLAATDGYRLAERRFVEKVESEVTAIVPAGSLQEVMRMLSDDTDEVEICFDETQVKFKLGEVEITSKLIDGSFPDYRQLIPKESEINVELKRDELVRITKLAALFAKEVGGSIVCETNTTDGVFTTASVANELGENKSEIKTTANADGKVTLNSRFLLDALNAVGGDVIEMGFANRLDPVVIKGKKNNEYIHIVMPLKG